jgi:AGZA family xanthine/uracil permease-like MFS transporter
LIVISLFFLFFAFITSAAASSVLIFVGVLMMQSVVDIDLTQLRTSVPAFLTIVGMPFTYSITNGMGHGLLSYVIINSVIFGIDFIKFKSGYN